MQRMMTFPYSLSRDVSGSSLHRWNVSVSSASTSSGRLLRHVISLVSYQISIQEVLAAPLAGVVLFQMLTGTLPFDGADSLALMYQHAMQAPPALASRGTDAGPHLEAVIARALAKNPDDRYPDAQAMRTALTAPTSAGTPSVPSRPGSAASPPGTPRLPELPEASKPPAHGPHAQTRTAEAPSPPPVPERPVDPEMLALISLTREAAEAERLEDTPAACRLYAELAERSARKLGPVAVATLLARHNHAHWAGEAGDAAKARDLMAAVAKDRTRVLGANHPDTLASRHEYALWMGVAGDARKARAQMRAVVSDRTGLLGANHPDALASRHDYARWTGKQVQASGPRACSRRWWRTAPEYWAQTIPTPWCPGTTTLTGSRRRATSRRHGTCSPPW